MGKSRWVLLLVFSALGGRALAADEIRVVVEEVPSSQVS